MARVFHRMRCSCRECHRQSPSSGRSSYLVKRGEMNKPTAFIASSQESVSLVSELKAALKRTFEVLPWNAGTFRDGEYFLESLVKTAGRVNLAIFVFASDDTTITRDRRVMTARDNVVLEYGLF